MTDDLDKILSIEESSFSKDLEIDRILNCDEFDYFAILNINPLKFINDDTGLLNTVRKTYRRRSLLIHPDKTNNTKAPLAFDRFKKAETILSINLVDLIDTDDITLRNKLNEKKRLISIYEEIKQQLGIENDRVDIDIELDRIRQEVSIILKEEVEKDEISRLQQQQKDAARMAEQTQRMTERQLKKQMENKWEDDRDQRVKSWRKYTNKVEKKAIKKKKKDIKPKVL
ncbi:uncharacterized protein RJT21DRAFT_121094, partial [Scheffersomyces amazonensis]|uniref:uncharacterized protein n=1 Tax=Scheffersomyces amazonensis TaxID=1078765 RepID=UPI00315D3DD9